MADGRVRAGVGVWGSSWDLSLLEYSWLSSDLYTTADVLGKSFLGGWQEGGVEGSQEEGAIEVRGEAVYIVKGN